MNLAEFIDTVEQATSSFEENVTEAADDYRRKIRTAIADFIGGDAMKLIRKDISTEEDRPRRDSF